MKKTILTAIIILAFVTLNAQVYVKGYYRSNGTYVKSYQRTRPNNTVYDNYSTRGNINPYTGKMGTKNNYGNFRTNSLNSSSWNNNYSTTNNLYNTNSTNNNLWNNSNNTSRSGNNIWNGSNYNLNSNNNQTSKSIYGY